MKKVGLYTLPFALLIFGLAIMISISTIIKSPQVACLVILGTFVIYNFALARWLGLSHQLAESWHPKKVWHLIPGFVIGSLPIGIALVSLSTEGELPQFKQISIIPILFTFASVSWEEAWFRGTPLELTSRYYSKFGAALLFGLIFCLLHFMNPKIDLIQDGLQLWLAGYTLSVCYFAFGSIWSAIGMHFANNIIQAFFGMSTEPRSWSFYFPLIAIALVLTIVVWKQSAEGDAVVLINGSA